jgi:hypothetical protein
MERDQEANRRIEAICAANDQFHYIDIYSKMMLNEDTMKEDIFLGDRTHMH